MKTIKFIVNPISGRGRKIDVPALIDKHLDKNLFDAEVIYTEYAGHAAEIAAECAKNGVDVVVAVGGDGTVNEIAGALVHTHTALAIIPRGSGNGLARHLQIPRDAKKAIDIINKNTVHTLDYGKLNDKPFFCTCGVGFDAFLAHKFAEAGKRGFATYIEKSLTDGLRYKSETYEIRVDDGEPRQLDAFVIACANATQYGNNAMIAPQASMKDGLIDVVVIKPFPMIESGLVATQLFHGTLQNNSHVESFQARKIEISRQQEGPVHCDGEPFISGAELTIEIVPLAIDIVVNPKAKGHNDNGIKLLGEMILEWNRRILDIVPLDTK